MLAKLKKDLSFIAWSLSICRKCHHDQSYHILQVTFTCTFQVCYRHLHSKSGDQECAGK